MRWKEERGGTEGGADKDKGYGRGDRELYGALLKTVAREGITEIAPIGSRIKELLFYCGVQFD